MNRKLACIAAALAFLSACQSGAPRKRRQRLTVYCSVTFEWCELMKTEFEKRTGITVSMTRKSSGETLAQIKAERRNPKGDVWWGGTGDAHVQAAESGLTEPYRSPRVDELHTWAKDPAGKGEFRAHGIYMGVLGFGYNADWLAKRGIATPASWADLVKPIYRGEIQMANPNSSGTAYTALATFVQLFGEDQAFEYLKKLHANINQYTKSGTAPIRAAARGETGVGIVFLHDAVTQKQAGFPIVEVTPSEGTGYEIGGLSIIHGARHLENAQRFADFALSPEAQDLGEQAHAFQIPSNENARIPPSAPAVDPAKIIDFDFRRFGSQAERDRLLRRWETEVNAAAR